MSRGRQAISSSAPGTASGRRGVAAETVRGPVGHDVGPGRPGAARLCSEEGRDVEGNQWAALRMGGYGEMREKEVVCDDVRDPVPRSFAIKRKECLEAYGNLLGCASCMAV